MEGGLKGRLVHTVSGNRRDRWIPTVCLDVIWTRAMRGNDEPPCASHPPVPPCCTSQTGESLGACAKPLAVGRRGNRTNLQERRKGSFLSLRFLPVPNCFTRIYPGWTVLHETVLQPVFSRGTVCSRPLPTTSLSSIPLLPSPIFPSEVVKMESSHVLLLSASRWHFILFSRQD